MKFIIIIIAVGLAIASFLYYMGMLSRVLVAEEQKGPYTFAYVEYVGPYSGVGKPMEELDKQMRAAGFDSRDGIGLYYDDPKTTPKDELKSEVGFLITEADMGKIDANTDKFNFKTLATDNYVTAEFPVRNMLSYMFGPMKVYPAINDYLNKNGIKSAGAGIEIYDMAAKKIYFLMKTER